MSQQTFQMPNRLDAIDPMVLSLKRQVEGLLPDEAVFRFDICLCESLTNLVEHATPVIDGAIINVILTLLDTKIEVEIFDPEGAAAFDLRDHGTALSDVDAMAEGGRGLGLILECADRVTYGSIDGRNRLCLCFWGRE